MSKKKLSKLLQEAKELNIPLRDFMRMKQELEKAIVETQQKYRDIIFRNDLPNVENA